MSVRVRTLRNIPTDKKEQTEADYRAEGATDIKWTKQADGRWTMTATFPASGG
jgi:hypothetical protein